MQKENLKVEATFAGTNPRPYLNPCKRTAETMKVALKKRLDNEELSCENAKIRLSLQAREKELTSVSNQKDVENQGITAMEN